MHASALLLAPILALVAPALAGPAAAPAPTAPAVVRRSAHNNLNDALGVSPAFPPFGAPLERRAIDYSCASSVLSQLSPPTSGVAAALTQWASTAVETHAPCTMTVPASLSDAYISYISVIITYLSTVESAASAIHTKCGADTFSLTFTQFCRTSQTVLFTNQQNQTRTTVLPPLSPPTNVIYINAAAAPASRQHAGVVGTAAAMAAILAVAVAL